ncbi:hypothetical protein [Flavobacterium daemonense]|uniref:hypothetical protein n=1 Tax=Flavobacterium daemonense TaxID=1393049 RepID=UPI001186A514|nr:hypothetical protein [Flavobacterium daemonense]KAF2330690.1 hypothetical protein FND99_14795 [Flavobacterium daemonense]
MKIIFIFLLCILTSAVFSQEKKCSDFKVGTFSYNNLALKRYKVVRKKTVQIETDTITGLVLEGSIKWKSDCNYVLTYTKVSNMALKKLLGQKINVEIINVFGNVILCRSEGFGVKRDLQMTKIKN